MLVVADTGNHRVLIWHALPDRDEHPCDVVLGQPDATSEGPAAGGTSTTRGMFLPTGVTIHDGRLIVADAWHHRVLVYDGLPESPFARPDLVLGQPGPDHVEPNAGGECGATTMYWPFGVGVVDGRFYVCDTGNRRVLGWSQGVPDSPGRRPDLVLGQPDAAGREENRGGPAGPDSFRWPHDVCGDGDRLLIADAGNHRVLGWRPHPTRDAGADLVLGQHDLTSTDEWPYGPQRADRLRSPYAADTDAGRLAVADTANNRVLIWTDGPRRDAADVVLGQPTFAANGENRWTGVTPDSMCWPYGISLAGDRLAVADSGNNRVVIWRRG
ncbi:NHL repeat-containing protein [Dactylosporangium sp. NPDC005572]|uniref:NHL repeat-containing protein n=1 Tax=Dactylosporangium sp. NPDC005572 TaxID=3156889 RepID=UPI00339E9E7B